MEYKKGNYFGERALITNDFRAASIQVTSQECTVLTLQRETFTRLLGNLEEILKRNMEEYQKLMDK